MTARQTWNKGRIATLATLVVAAMAACGGAGQSGRPAPVLPQGQTPPVLRSAASAISIPSGIVSTQGSDAGPRSGGFYLGQGSPNGLIPVTVTQSTVVDGALAKNVYVLVTGTGSVHTGMTATYATTYSSPPSSTTASGKIVAATAYGFTLNVNTTYPHVPIVLNSGVVVGGGALQPGASAKVTGPGSLSTSITPVQIVISASGPATPTPGPIAEKHVLTTDYLGGTSGTRAISWSTAARYVTWAQTGVGDANAISAAGIKTQFYIDPNRVQTDDTLYTSDETTFAHDCSGHRITDTYSGRVVQYVMNVESATYRALYHAKAPAMMPGAHFDAIFEDDAGPLTDFLGTTNFTPSLPCDYTDAAWLSGGEGMEAAPPIPTIFNGLSGLQGHNPSLSIGLLSNATTIGGNYEHCYADDTQPKMSGWAWTAMENTELQVIAKHKLFECQTRNTSSAASMTNSRIYALASFLLTYNWSTSLLWEQFATTSGFHVEPESQLVLLDPKVTTPASITGLVQSGGNYGREYSQCYLAGKFVAPCAVVVNPDAGSAHVFPFPQYTHTLVLTGGGIVDGGTVATNGPPPPEYLPALGSAVVFP
jgi:hypothetical protein